MLNRVLADAGDRRITPVQWRTVEALQARTAPPTFAARKEDAQDTERLHHQIEKAAEEAYARGFTMGVDSCKADMADQARPVLEKLSQSIQTLAGMRARLRREAEADLVKLSLAVARRILNRELSIDPDSVQSIIRLALEKLQSKEVSRVRMHPSHEAVVRSCLKNLGASNQIQFSADPSLELGCVIFETPHGDLDASVDFQLREIERGFADRLAS